MQRPLLIGEAPGGDNPRNESLLGASGKNIARITGLTWTEYIEGTRRTNIFRTQQRGAWDSAAARKNAADMAREIEPGTRVVLFGVRVAEAFGVSHWPLHEWLQLHPGVMAVRLPHPSGRNFALNAALTRAMFRKTMREAL